MVRTRSWTWRLWLPLVLGLLVAVAIPGSASAASDTPYDFHAWRGVLAFGGGTLDGGAMVSFEHGGSLTLRKGATEGSWTSQVYKPGVPVSQLVSSWQATTPPGSWIETHLSVHIGSHWSKWFVMGKWAFDSSTIKRTSVSGQTDADGDVSVDTYLSNAGQTADAYRLQEVLHSTDGVADPTVRQVAATASDPHTPSLTPSPTTMTSTVDLGVPSYSQDVHAGEYPQYDGGGEAWCSPTSTEMVVEYWHRGPSKQDVASLPPDPVFDQHGRVDGSVDWAAIHTYDLDYAGAGNWPFNAAYASAYGLDGSVRQFDSLQGLERWVKRGVPVVTSISWNNNSSDPSKHLDGASIAATPGHLMVVRGFTKTGDVIANDPASPTDAAVRHVYKRNQFEYRWQSASTGMTYLIKPYWITG
jgi:Peptidase_C39 like family